MNWLRYSTREMSVGNRIETLSEHFNDWNWQKLLGLGTRLFGLRYRPVDLIVLIHLSPFY